MNLNATLIIEVLSFLILLGLLVKFLYRPVLNVLDKRAEEIRQASQQIQEDLASAEKERSEAARILVQTKEQALEIKEKAGLDAEKVRQKIINQAKNEAGKALRASREEIARQSQKAKDEIRSEVADLSVKAAEKILRRKFAAGDQKRLIEELTEGINSHKLT